jgi:enamine deaminase RidA (YjgF/YER057c/UK114 family)
MERQNVSSGTKYESIVGYSRAVRAGNRIYVSGTAPIAENGSTAHTGDLYQQTKHCLQIIENAIKKLGGKMENVVRTRVYLTDADRWEEAGKAHGEVFGKILPATTFLEVNRLLKEDWLVEIEAECIL